MFVPLVTPHSEAELAVMLGLLIAYEIPHYVHNRYFSASILAPLSSSTIVSESWFHWRRRLRPLFVPRPQLNLRTPESGLATYTFNMHVINHHFCPKCGCAPFGFGKDRSGAATAAVNVRCLEGIELSSLKKVPVDGRSF